MIDLNLNPNDDIQHILNQYPYDALITIRLAAGTYHQKLTFNHHHLTLIGASIDTTIITFDDYSYKMHEDGLLYNTFRTSTVTVIGSDVTFHHLTIKNAAGSGPTIGQAIALSVYGTRFRAINCAFVGHQDTLFIGPLPVDLIKRYDEFLPTDYLHTHPVLALFDQCKISGDVDFIFGSGTGLFVNCDITCLEKGYIFAPSTYQSFPFGMIVMDSTFHIHKLSYIARPWREFAKVHLINNTFEGVVHQDRYDDWDKFNFTFKEYPFFQSKLSSICNDEERGKLATFIQLNF